MFTPIPTWILFIMGYIICWKSYDSRKKAVWTQVLCYSRKPTLCKKEYVITTLFSNEMWWKSYLKELYFHQNVLKLYRIKVQDYVFLCLHWVIQIALFAQHIEHNFYLFSLEWLLCCRESMSPSSVNRGHMQQTFLWTVFWYVLSVLLQLKPVALCVDVYGLSHNYLNECDDDMDIRCSKSGNKPYATSEEHAACDNRR